MSAAAAPLSLGVSFAEAKAHRDEARKLRARNAAEEILQVLADRLGSGNDEAFAVVGPCINHDDDGYASQCDDGDLCRNCWRIDGTVDRFGITLDPAAYGQVLPMLVEFVSDAVRRAGWASVQESAAHKHLNGRKATELLAMVMHGDQGL